MKNDRTAHILEMLGYYSNTFARISLTNPQDIGEAAALIISSTLTYGVSVLLFDQHKEKPELLACKGIDRETIAAWTPAEAFLRLLWKDIYSPTSFNASTLEKEIADSAHRLGLGEVYLAVPFTVVSEHSANRRGFAIAAQPSSYCVPDVDIMALGIIAGFVSSAITNCIAMKNLVEINNAMRAEISDRERAEAALRQSEETLRAITNAANDAIVLMDSDGRISYWNPAAERIFGYSVKETIGNDLHLLLAPQEFHDAYRQGFEKFMKMGRGPAVGKTVQFTAIRKDGTRFPIEVSTSSIKINKEWHAAGIIRDISERIKMEEELWRAQKLESLGVLAGGIAHDFNNLLTGILGNVSLLLFDIDSKHPHYEKLIKISKLVDSGARLTTQLLGYARKGKYEIKPVDLNRLIEETAETFGRTRKEITISLDLHKGLFAIDADGGQIEHVLWNIFVNAADAMPGGGNLTVKTINTNQKDTDVKTYDAKPGNYVLLKISDTGIGMTKEIQGRIFDPFFTTKEMGRGTGLGLASAYGIIKSHGGYIHVDSEKGRGSTFSIYLPATRKRIVKDVQSARQVVKGTGTVLLVDDEKEVREVSQRLLEAAGYRVLVAKDAEEAIRTYRKNFKKIDIVLLDMIMPNTGGGEVYDRMKEIDPNIKVLLSSGYSIDSDARQILARGCNGFLQKPFTLLELSEKVAEILGNR